MWGLRSKASVSIKNCLIVSKLAGLVNAWFKLQSRPFHFFELAELNKAASDFQNPVPPLGPLAVAQHHIAFAEIADGHVVADEARAADRVFEPDVEAKARRLLG